MKEYDEKHQRENNGKPLAGTIQERDAYADPRYREVAERMAISKATVSFLQQKFKQFEATYNIWRSVNANMRTADRM